MESSTPATEVPIFDYVRGVCRFLAKGLYPIASLANSSAAQRAFRAHLVRDDQTFGRPRPAVVIISLGFGDNYTAFAEITRRRTAEYAALHNYTFVYINRSIDDAYRPTWQKIVLLKLIMTGSSSFGVRKPDFLMLIDADAYITNMSVLVENFFNPPIVDRSIDFIVTSDHLTNVEVEKMQASAITEFKLTTNKNQDKVVKNVGLCTTKNN